MQNKNENIDSFKYDAFGRRIYKSSSGGTSVFAYDADNMIEETNSSGAVVARYAQTQNVDEPMAELRSGTTSYYEADGLNSATSLSNASGTLAQTYTFDSFGNQTASSGSLTNPFQYASREFDTEANLYFMRARYFDPKTGRFLSEDPIGFRGEMNFYSYSSNNPVNLIDPFGLYPTAPAIPWAGGPSLRVVLGWGFCLYVPSPTRLATSHATAGGPPISAKIRIDIYRGPALLLLVWLNLRIGEYF